MKTFFRKVLVAINGRQSSIHAAMYAIMMAKAYSLELKFVFVIDTATIKYLTMNNLLINSEKMDFEEKLEVDGQHYLDYVKMLAGSKGIKCHTELRKGGIFTEILNAAEEFNADLILLGGNEKDVNKKGVKKFVMTSDENEVLSNSTCPVLIVQEPDIEKKFKSY